MIPIDPKTQQRKSLARDNVAAGSSATARVTCKLWIIGIPDAKPKAPRKLRAAPIPHATGENYVQ